MFGCSTNFAAVLIEKKSELLKSQFRGFSHFKVLNYTQDASSSSVVSPVVGAIVSHSYFVSGVSLFLLFSFQPPSWVLFPSPLSLSLPLFLSLGFCFWWGPSSSSARIPFPHHDLPSLAAPQSVMKGWPCSEHTVTCDNECEPEEEGQDRRRRRGVQRVGAARRSHRLQGSDRPLQGKFDEVHLCKICWA